MQSLLKNMMVGAKLALGFGLTLALLALIVGMSWRFLDAMKSEFQALEQVRLRASLIDSWRDKTELNSNRTLAIMQSGSAGLSDTFDPMIKKTSAEISEINKALEAALQNDAEKAQLAEISAKRKDYIAARDDVFARIKAQEDGVGETIQGKFIPASRTYIAAITGLRDLSDKEVLVRQKETDESIRAKQVTLAILGVLAAAIGAGGAWLITQSVTAPLHRAVESVQSIARGNLSQTIQADGRDEVSNLLDGLAQMQNSLRQIVQQVRDSSGSIATGSGQIASGNADLSQRTEQQASNLQETAASMEQLTVTVTNSSETARQASELATSASGVAAKGQAVVGQVISTMDEITASSKKIGDIISVIDGIAFQTNILALNAAVEAARAGEQGRGFAVVASEVRSLAQRSASAAKEIKTLIGTSVEKVEAGSKLVGDAGATMADMVTQVQRVADLIVEIRSASHEQAQGIGNINEAVMQLDQVTQQNAALVEESAAAAESLRQQSARLVDAVNVFRIEPAHA